MSEFIKRIKTADGDTQIDYTALANLPNQYTGTGQNEDGWMTQKAVTDCLTDIYNKVSVSARISEVTLLASAWTGADSLYSQVVTIDGITEYSKVDLLPSVEQLAIFHNKDVAFVTENEDGVVTVYAIGDKPTLDYTIQVSITEVIA